MLSVLITPSGSRNYLTNHFIVKLVKSSVYSELETQIVGTSRALGRPLLADIQNDKRLQLWGVSASGWEPVLRLNDVPVVFLHLRHPWSRQNKQSSSQLSGKADVTFYSQISKHILQSSSGSETTSAEFSVFSIVTSSAADARRHLCESTVGCGKRQTWKRGFFAADQLKAVWQMKEKSNNNNPSVG